MSLSFSIKYHIDYTTDQTWSSLRNLRSIKQKNVGWVLHEISISSKSGKPYVTKYIVIGIFASRSAIASFFMYLQHMTEISLSH